jgi:pilus assembly protein Flp/PilA
VQKKFFLVDRSFRICATISPSAGTTVAATPEIPMLQFIREEEGATAIEYGLIASLIAVFIIAAVGLVGANLSSTFNEVASHL